MYFHIFEKYIIIFNIKKSKIFFNFKFFCNFNLHFNVCSLKKFKLKFFLVYFAKIIKKFYEKYFKKLKGNKRIQIIN